MFCWKGFIRAWGEVNMGTYVRPVERRMPARKADTAGRLVALERYGNARE